MYKSKGVCVKGENAPNPPPAKQPVKFPCRYIADMADRTCHLTYGSIFNNNKITITYTKSKRKINI